MHTEEAPRAYALADAYRILSVFLQLPTPEVAAGLVDGSLMADVRAVLAEAGFSDGKVEEVAGALAAQEFSAKDAHGALRRDYTRLFTNPEKPVVPIYESVYKGSSDFDTSSLVFVSPTAIDAERAYREFDLEVSHEHRESSDHMCAEVEFMCALYLRCAQCIEAGNMVGAAAARKAKADFLAKHLLKWGEGFFDSVREHAATSAYTMVGALGLLLMRYEVREADVQPQEPRKEER